MRERESIKEGGRGEPKSIISSKHPKIEILTTAEYKELNLSSAIVFWVPNHSE
jgi:hypothetical protein